MKGEVYDFTMKMYSIESFKRITANAYQFEFFVISHSMTIRHTRHPVLAQ